MQIKPQDCVAETYGEKYSGWIHRPKHFVRITHIPSGIVVCSEDKDKSLHANAHQAWNLLQAQLDEFYKPKINLLY